MANPKLVPVCKIEVEGKEIPPHAQADLKTVTVEQRHDGADRFRFEMSNLAFWSDSKHFQEGKKIKVSMGYLGDGPHLVFEGEILQREVLFPVCGPSVLFVSGFDLSHRLRRTQLHRSFRKMTDSEIAKKIASEAGLKSSVDATSTKREWIYQINQNNFEFLSERARSLNFEVKVTGDTLVFRKPKTSGSEVGTLKWGENLLSFRPRLSTAGLPAEVQVRGWDPDTKKAVVGKAKNSDVGTKLGSALGLDLARKCFGKSVHSISDKPVRTVAEAEKVAKAKIAEASLNFVQGVATCRGDAKIKAGSVIRVEGVGKRFEGKYYLLGVQHIFDHKGVLTMLSLARNAVQDASATPVKDSQYSRDMKEAAAKEAKKEKPKPVVANARWSKDRASEGKMVLMLAEAHNFDPGTPATFKIFHRDPSGKTSFVEEKQGEVAGSEVRSPYSYTYQEGRELQPANFFFKVSVGGKEASSDFLKVRNAADFNATVDGTDIPLSLARFQVKLPDGSTVDGRLDEDGKATLPQFSPGKYEITFPED